MITYSKETLKRWASECIDVEFYKFIGEKESIHTDSVRSIDVSWEDLPEDVECEYLQADEEDYNNTLYANVGKMQTMNLGMVIKM